MKNKIFYILLIVCTVCIPAQITYEGPAEGSVPIGTILNTNDFFFVEKSYRDFKTIDEPKTKFEYQRINFIDSQYPERVFFNLQTTKNPSADSINVFQNFQGIPQTNYNPPDDYIAAGPDHLIVVVNNLWRIYDKSGNIQRTINAADWYSNVVGAATPVDPKILYDHFDNRWLMVWIYIDHTQLRSYYLVSVSDDRDPNGIWFNWALPSNLNGSLPSDNWGDYEGVGFSEDAVFITSNQFSFSGVYEYVKLRIINKKDIYINSKPEIVKWKDIWNISIPGSSSSASYLRPSRMQEASTEFYLFYLPNAGGNFCAVYEVINALTNPELDASVYLVVPYGIAPDAKQPGSDVLIQGGFSALRNEPFFRDGILHAVHCIKNPEYPSLSALHYLAIDPVQNILKTEMVMGDNKNYYFYPALAVDEDSNIIISYSRCSTNEYAGGFFTIIPNKSGIPSKSIELVSGNSYFNRDNGSGRSRWGDYSGAWLDPVDEKNFWISVEYVEAVNTWGTWIGGIRYEDSITVGQNNMNTIIKDYEMYQNYPNPFNPSTTIRFEIPASLNPSKGGTFVTLKVYDVLGNEIETLINEEKSAGNYKVTFIADELSSGIYFYQLKAQDLIQTKKMILLK